MTRGPELWYFAYGSNMLRSRLEERVGPVALARPGVLEDFRHSFTKLGADGTGKGNISGAPGQRVYGVLYQLSPMQLEELRVYEGGYHAITVSVVARQVLLDELMDRPVDAYAAVADTVESHTFQARAPVSDMRPRDEYLDYYLRGMHEHGLPEVYRAFIRAQAHLRGEGNGDS